jgi:hypothetical protein
MVIMARPFCEVRATMELKKDQEVAARLSRDCSGD